MASGILYVDSRPDRSVKRALQRHARVWHATDINSAMFLMAERDFEYYFVEADTPQARAFLLHLRHDPQLPPPKAIVLLTDNDDEDCEAWKVDAFVTRSRVGLDAPYIFSHLKGFQGEEASVLRIGPAAHPGSVGDLRKAKLRQGARGGDTPVTPPVESTGEAAETARTGDGDLEGLRCARREVIRSVAHSPGKTRVPRSLFAAGFLILAIGLWLFTLGPLSSSSRRAVPEKSLKNLEAETDAEVKGRAETEDEKESAPAAEKPPATDNEPAADTAAAVQPVAAEESPTPGTVEQPVDQTAGTYMAPTAFEQQVNSPPSVSISGPGQLPHGETANYTASAEDPDGDPVSLDWTSRSMCWSTPGLFTITVTATDSRGASYTASKSVRVI